MQWWCSAQGAPWTWAWRPYLGVWLLVLLTAVAYRRAYRATAPWAVTEGRELRRWRVAAAASGIGGLWLMLDWPIGALGAGYLASVHSFQFLGLALALPPLLLFGLPPGWEAARGPRTAAILERVTQPLAAFVGFLVIVFLTHLPPIVDALMVTQAGSFLLDLAWLLGGLTFWWPVVRRWPSPGLGPAARLLYVLGGTAARMGIGMFMALAPFPLFRVFELAPPIARIDAFEDQQRAGGLMMFGDVLVGLAAVGILIYIWQRDEHERLARAAGNAVGREVV
jgi:putative membrane protein